MCGTCLCDPPEGTSCELPLSWAAHAAQVCNSAAQVTGFSAPAGWGGQCTAVNAIPAGQMCGAALCAQSLSIDAPVVVPGACAPRMDEPPAVGDVAWPWATFARACVGTAYPPCTDHGSTCAPAPPDDGDEGAPPGGFLTCVFHEGERACPETYPQKRVFYSGVDDTRDCTSCACGDPQGAECSILATAYTDGQCAASVASNTVSSLAPLCVNLPPGVALGSKSAVVKAIEPGACAPSGGQPTGGVAPSEPATFCCR